jgi:hypothetical protein
MSSYLPDGFRRIPRAAENYAVSPDGAVFNMKTKKLLKPQWAGDKEFVTVKDEHGKQFRFCFEDLDRMDYEPLTKEWVFHVEQAREIPDYPDYAISHYGAVYRVATRRSGRRAKEVHMIKSHLHQGRETVYLRNKNKPHKRFRVDKLVEQLWGEESTYED